ncbi:RraA family protein [Priestia megaterium]|uniref:RraA family protein n=1 Tax=Priestia megaterium TaxID=1404 RepID=UPI0024531FE2|nr:RraA family protein [Priestia megaterium]MDH3183561.1 RraA family protein [Priestia megaterium]MDH3183601.1 RraA family protein [Priestia megaterium]
MSNLGLKIVEHIDRLPQSLIDGYKGLATANIADVMGRFRAMDYTVKSMNRLGVHLVGSALTIRIHPTDNLMIHKAMDLAKPGDVLVIDAFGGKENAVVGELICHYAKIKGIAGIVTSSPIRDTNAIYNMDIPVFARGATPRGPLKEGSGEINTTISCGLVPVNPGDIIVGDDDGVVVVPKSEAVSVLEETKKIQEKEQSIIDGMYESRSWERKWVDETLYAKGYSPVKG